MVKYIKVDWPESQKFVEYPEVYIGIPNDHHKSNAKCTYLVPEDLYNKVIIDSKPNVYNTNIGTICCYNKYTIVKTKDGIETIYFEIDDNIERGDGVLLKIDDKWAISKVTACSEAFPIILENPELLIGINCELIGYCPDEKNIR